MKTILLTTLALGLTSAFAADASAVKLTQAGKAIKVEIGGQPFTTYHFAGEEGAVFFRPYFYPVLASDGVAVTSDQVVAKGDHPHHRSIWVAHGEVNGVDHWANKSAKQNHVSFSKVEGDMIEEVVEWESAQPGQALLKETRTWRFFAYPDGTRGVDLTSVYEAVADKVTFGDTKEAGLCSVRVPKAISATATITQSTGATGEKACWGKPAAWCDISGTIDGKPYGVAVLDHPSNPRHPSAWHVRQYGLLTANIFGLSYYDKKNPKGSGNFDIVKGKPVTFKYRVVIHTGDCAAAKLEEKWKEFAGK
jgi:hypothetical protein